MSAPFGWVDEAAVRRRAAGLQRHAVPLERSLVDCASNDYLGLSRDERVLEAARAALTRYGAGSTGSRVVTGTTDAHVQLERELAAFVGTQAALVFSSGYLANLGVLQALTDTSTLVVSDQLNHASIVDACRLSRARVAVTPHRDVEAVAAALAGRSEPRAVVVTDAVFSVDGDAAPLAELVAVARHYGAGVVVDEAHALGVVGDGRGLTAALGLAGADDIVLTVTLSKALASQGGAVLASRPVIDHILNTGRAFLFDTALAPSAAAAATAALHIVATTPELPAAARAATRHIADLATSLGLRTARPAAAVASVVIGSSEQALRAAEDFRGFGVNVGVFRPPSVPDAWSRLRLTGRAVRPTSEVERIYHALRALAAARSAGNTALADDSFGVPN